MISKEEKKDLDKLYALYGFAKMSDTDEYMVFTYSNGYFYNAEIIRFVDSNSTIKKIKSDFENTGYSVREIQYTSVVKTHELLFNGFFGIEHVNSRLSKDYDSFCQLQAQKLFDSKYEYVEPTYFWNNGSRHEDLLGDILRQLNQTGAQLIILEAAAGYGKTCTSYE